MSFDMMLIFIILIWTFIYTISYAGWTWKNKNRFGALMVIILAIAVLALPIYTLFFKE